MENKPIELFLISGFLGSGKTTFLQNILTGLDPKRVGVIVNEFGSLGIDAKLLSEEEIPIVEINRGSVFCACLKGGFIKTLAAFLTQPVDRLYVEASGMADPSGMEEMLPQLEPLIEKRYKTERRYEYKGCVCLVNPRKFYALTRSVPAIISQVKKSNLVVINKTDTVDRETIERTKALVKEYNPGALVYETTYAKVPEEILLKALTGERILEYKDSLNTPENRPYGGVIKLSEILEKEVMEDFIEEISRVVYRIKGFFKTRESIFFVSCVDGDISITEGSCRENELCLVLISPEDNDISKAVSEIWRKYFDIPLFLREE